VTQLSVTVIPNSKGDNLLSVSTESQVRNSVECNSKYYARISKSKNKPCKQAIKHREHRGLFYRSSHSLQSGTSPLRKLLSQPAPKRALSSFTYLVWNPFDPTAAGQADPNRLHKRLEAATQDLACSPTTPTSRSWSRRTPRSLSISWRNQYHELSQF
jgi:hypothetical protein